MRVESRDLFDLMPMHLCLDDTGAIVSCGRTMARLLGGHDRLDQAFGMLSAIIMAEKHRTTRYFPEIYEE